MKKLFLNKALLKKIFVSKALIITLFTISGMLSLIIVILLFAGKIDLGNSIVSALEKGNKFYVTNKYDKAIEAYKTGLSKNKEDTKLNNNTAMASYNLKKYSDALTYLNKAPEKIEKYMKIGNSNFKLGEASNDANMKTQLFQKALEAYKQGIIKYPQDVDLKFNYEFVKKKLDDQNNKDDQENQDDKKDEKDQDKKDEQNKDKKDNENNQDNKGQNDKENKDEKNKDQDNKDQNSNDQNKDNKDSKSQDNKQNDKQDKENSQDKNSQQQDKEQDKDKKDGSQQSSESEQNKDKDDKKNQAQMNDKNNDGKGNKNMTEVQQVLQLLEQQEEESLKNNQGIKVEGKEAEHDW